MLNAESNLTKQKNPCLPLQSKEGYRQIKKQFLQCEKEFDRVKQGAIEIYRWSLNPELGSQGSLSEEKMFRREPSISIEELSQPPEGESKNRGEFSAGEPVSPKSCKQARAQHVQKLEENHGGDWRR